MKLIVFMILVGCLQVSATGLAQTVTYSAKNTSLQKVFAVVKEQTGYVFFYKPGLLKGAKPVTVSASNTPLDRFLEQILSNQSLDYFIESKTIVIRPKAPVVDQPIPPTIGMMRVSGVLVHNDSREPLAGASIAVKGTKVYVITNSQGRFEIEAAVGDVLLVSYVGFQTKEVKVFGADLGLVFLSPANNTLDETVVQAYGTTSRRLSTSNITKVSGEELNKAPVANPLAALQGRAPGIIITQSSGVPGSAFSVQIRGRAQFDKFLSASDEPLYIIDGVPMATGNANINLVSSAISASGTSGLSPFSSINMADIESIEILKDADATAIYGSRGASGVVMITTRKGKAGNMKVDLSLNTGISKVKLPDLLTTKEYVAMRREALKNDNKIPDATNAYDLMVWDTTRDENLAKQLIGGTATVTNGQVSLSGGNSQTQYLAGGGYYRETDVYPGTFPNTRYSAHFNINTYNNNRKLNAMVSANYSSSNNQTAGTDLAMKILMAPNYRVYDSVGNLAWNEKGVWINGVDNPLAYTKQKYSAKTDNLSGNLTLNYKIIPELALRTSIGYNSFAVNEVRIMPKAAQNPANITTGSTTFGNNNFKSWIVEPQAEYIKAFGRSKVNVLMGGTFQSQRNSSYNFTANGYTSDEFLGSLAGVPAGNIINPASIQSEYKYQAFFGRITYNYDYKYLLNLSARRDGSSRFGPDYRFSNFGAIGGAWIFTAEPFMQNVPFISYGKLRGSYGVTGNDKIGDYKYLDAYTSYVFYPTYRDSTALTPSGLFKPDLHWERNVKSEIALELGFLKDRVLFSVAWYHNRTSDPLVDYPLPTLTGFSSISANLNGVVISNSGFEFMLNPAIIKNKNFEWSANINLTIPKNKLVRFPDLDQSSYANKYVIGQSLSTTFIGHFIGVDPQTGLSMVEDYNKSGKFEAQNATGDLQPLFNVDPDFYGGIQNTLRYKNLQLDVLLQFTKQIGQTWMSSLGVSAPIGFLNQNVPDVIGDRWQKPGDISSLQKYTTVSSASNSLTGNYASYFSDQKYADVSYLRVKNVSLSYALPNTWAKKIKMNFVRAFVLAQNLYTFSSEKNADPETVFMSRLPPLRTITAGIQLNF